ncbi:MAG: hypothetical protein RI573_15670 [Balneolaceae bacterium]|nr:hypothetical protein [Balneolaceae bacterium]
MKKILSALTIIFLITAVTANAQLREDLSYQPETYTTTLSSSQHTGGPGNWMNMLNMTMSHSYSMSFSSIGGQMQNINAYTNHMFFDVSDRLNAQLDISLLHSPFGNSFMTSNSNSLGAQIIVDQARIDYQLTDNATISFQFSQRPGYYGNGAYSPFNRMMRPWY